MSSAVSVDNASHSGALLAVKPASGNISVTEERGGFRAASTGDRGEVLVVGDPARCSPSWCHILHHPEGRVKDLFVVFIAVLRFVHDGVALR